MCTWREEFQHPIFVILKKNWLGELDLPIGSQADAVGLSSPFPRMALCVPPFAVHVCHLLHFFQLSRLDKVYVSSCAQLSTAAAPAVLLASHFIP